MKSWTTALCLTLLPLAGLAMTTPAMSAPSTGQSKTQNRCGWISNPTPANWFLIDRDGEWVMGMQGGYQMPESSYDHLPDHGRQWVRQNTGSYGYGCGCLHVSVDRANNRITRVVSGRALPLATCRADKRLPRP